MKKIFCLNMCYFITFTLLSCSGNDNQNNEDDSGATDSGTDTGTDIDTGYYNQGCDGFPPSNGSDGCTRELLSKTPEGDECTGVMPAMSADGSTVAFVNPYSVNNEDSCLPEDNNGRNDICTVDLETGTIELLVTKSDGTSITDGTGGDLTIKLSEDGNLVAFSSAEKSIIPAEYNYQGIAYRQCFVIDRQTKEIDLISVSTDEEVGNFCCSPVAMSADGRFVVYESDCSNLVDDDTNEKNDLFIRDRQEGTTERISVKTDGSEVPDPETGQAFVSNDGRFVTFVSTAQLSSEDVDWEGLDVYLRDRQTGETRLVSIAPGGYSSHDTGPLAIAPDGSWIVFYVDSGMEHYIGDEQADFVKANIGISDITFEGLSLGGSSGCTYEWSRISGNLEHAVFRSGNPNLVGGNMGVGYPEENYWVIENSVTYNSQTGTHSLVTAAEDGTPGTIPYYTSDTIWNDWVSHDISHNGSRIAFSNIQYGIVDPEEYGIYCSDGYYDQKFRVYLRDCTPSAVQN